MHLGKERLPANGSGDSQRCDEHGSERRTGEQGAAHAAFVVACEVGARDEAQHEHGQAEGEPSGEYGLHIGHMRDFALQEQRVRTVCDQPAKVARRRPVEDVVDGVGGVGGAVLHGEPEVVRRETRPVVLQPEEHRGGHGPDGGSEHHDGKEDGDHGLQGAGEAAPDGDGFLTLRGPPGDVLFRRADRQRSRIRLRFLLIGCLRGGRNLRGSSSAEVIGSAGIIGSAGRCLV